MSRILVIGAGVAGLAAARTLKQAGLSPIVLEARERCGGRIRSVFDPASPVPIELGAEFVHGLDPVLHGLLREYDAGVTEQEGEHVGARDWEGIGRIFGAMAGAPEQSFGDFIRHFDASDDAKRGATGYVEGFNAALKDEVSVEWLNLQSESDRNFRVLKGYQSLPEYLAQDLDVRYSTPVRRLNWRRGEIFARTDQGDFRAEKAIVTVPLAVLCSGDLPIEPEPSILTHAKSALGNGQAIRITFRFESAVWARHERLSFIHGDAPFPVWWTQYPVNAPLITGWAAGPKALALAGESAEQRLAIALDSLRRVLGEDPGTPLASYTHDWQADPWSRAAYSYVRTGGLNAQREFSEPVEETLYFAGEAAGPAEHIGTVHGAIAGGLAAARMTIR